jgi:hypothetical protein
MAYWTRESFRSTVSAVAASPAHPLAPSRRLRPPLLAEAVAAVCLPRHATKDLTPCSAPYCTAGHTAPKTSYRTCEGSEMAAPCQLTGLPKPVAPCRIRQNKASTASSLTKDCTEVGARKWSADGASCVGAVVIPIPRCSSDPARATNILAHGGDTAPPLA